MSNLNRSAFQGHPFHLVSPSPWPIFTCISLLTLTTSGVLTMHGFSSAGNWLPAAFILLASSMFFWFRDVISEGIYLENHTLAVQRGLNMGVALFAVLLAFIFTDFQGLEYSVPPFTLSDGAYGSFFYLNTGFYHFWGNIDHRLPEAIHGHGNYLKLKDGREIFDASGGAAVLSLGYNNKRIKDVVKKQLNTGVTYISSAYWTSKPVEDLSAKLINSTDGKLSKVYLTGSGSEAMETALKLSRQYFYCKDNKTSRVNFISRDRSYHGNTLGALSVSGFESKKKPYFPSLIGNVHFVSACYPYRQLLKNETNEQFVRRKVLELENKFIELGPHTVIGFIAEPVVGAALGCVPFVPGYLRAMQDVCHKYGSLLILDEVMCGIGRTGSLHAWKSEHGLSPDVQTMAKGLGAGYQPIGAVMVSPRIVDIFKKYPFIHGQTFDSMPLQASVALEVLNIIEEKGLVSKVNTKGIYLGKSLKRALSSHPNVGDIRGSGLFWGIELVKNKFTKEPYNLKSGVAYKIRDLALSPEFNLCLYQGTGTADGVNGDHIMISPSFLVTKKDINRIVRTVSIVVNRVLETVNNE